MERRRKLLEERIYKGEDGVDIHNMLDSDDEWKSLIFIMIYYNRKN